VEGDRAYVAGDVRANENTSLLVTHTVFLREHNRLVDVMRAADPSLSRQELYERARKMVGAEIQAITYHEFLPAMGVTLDSYTGYDATVNPTVLTEFSNAAFRVGHSQINAQQLRLDAAGHKIAQGDLDLATSFFQPDRLLEGGLEPLIRGLAAQVQEANDSAMVGELRNQLFSMFIPNFGLVNSATDLAAIDIVRGRDVGMPSLNRTRSALGLAPHQDFNQLTSDSALAAKLQTLYGSVDVVDLFVGLLTEDQVADTSLGETTIAIYSKQFGALRDGDRFWFENDLTGANSGLLMIANWDGNTAQSASSWLSTLRLSDILALNTNVRLQDDVFLAVPEPTSGAMLVSGLLAVGILAWRQSSRRTTSTPIIIGGQ
jgi:hypothetical protein